MAAMDSYVLEVTLDAQNESIAEILASEGLVGPIGDRLDAKLVQFIREEFAFEHRHKGFTTHSLVTRLTSKKPEATWTDPNGGNAA